MLRFLRSTKTIFFICDFATLFYQLFDKECAELKEVDYA